MQQFRSREISGPLSRLLNCCIRGGFYPGAFKVARVVPVFKGGDPTEFSNYRPVSVLPVLSQLFERVLKVRLVEFLEKEGVITPGQYGFWAGHSGWVLPWGLQGGEGGSRLQGGESYGVLQL